MNLSRKGNRKENRIVAFLEKHGYEVIMFRKSKGAFDRVAARQSRSTESRSELRYIQIKANRWPQRKELKRMADEPLPESATSREAWMVMDATGGPGGGFKPDKHMRCRRLDDSTGRWVEVPLLPEWENGRQEPKIEPGRGLRRAGAMDCATG
jgi:hypothetical protein